MSVLRYDNLAPRIDAVDPETGILRGRAVLAKEGVYRYSDQSGAVWHEYVPRSTLSDPAWIDSLKLAPVTLNHPTEMVTSDNARYLAVGAIGDGVVMLGDRLASPIAVYARDAVEAAQTTHKEISLGYYADVEMRKGQFDGQAYDRVQVNRRANHVALVEHGRHGPDVRLVHDTADTDTFTPPADVAAAARRGLELRAEQPPSNRGGTAVGIARAKQLANRDPVSLDTIKRMVSFFARHEVDKKGEGWGKDSKGYQAWLLWGGDPGRRWAESIVRRAEKKGDSLETAWQVARLDSDDDYMDEDDMTLKAKLEAALIEAAAEKARADKAEAERDELRATIDAKMTDEPAAAAEESEDEDEDEDKPAEDENGGDDEDKKDKKAKKDGYDACDMCGAPVNAAGKYNGADKAKKDALDWARGRVELETRVRSVTGAHYDCTGKDDRALRLDALTALGVKGVEDRSDDYIAARLDAALELRAESNTPAAVIAAGLNVRPVSIKVETVDANHLARKAWHYAGRPRGR
jgi:hypothetical protein